MARHVSAVSLYQALRGEYRERLRRNMAALGALVISDAATNIPKVTSIMHNSSYPEVTETSTSITLSIHYPQEYSAMVYFVTAVSGDREWLKVNAQRYRKDYVNVLMKK